jgi:hypothetical protein
MNGFDKFCAALAFALAIVFLILGVIGLFAGSSANFSLPTDLHRGFPVMPAGSIQQTRSPAENPYNDPS